jgi:predicted metal-dependent phosphoesterase TrpH
MHLYETHLHTYPVSKCARSSPDEAVEFYKSLGFSGIFVTNHFIDGNINIDKSLPYRERLEFYFSDYRAARLAGEKIGLSVFLGVEMSYKGTDFLVYGLSEEWYFAHPEIEGMKKSELLSLLSEAGALVIQAHPFRESPHIDHIRLFPKHVHGVEVINAARNEFENDMARHYAKSYGLIQFAGSDNHNVAAVKRLAGMKSHMPVESEEDFAYLVLSGQMRVFHKELS